MPSVGAMTYIPLVAIRRASVGFLYDNEDAISHKLLVALRLWENALLEMPALPSVPTINLVRVCTSIGRGRLQHDRCWY